MCAALPSGCAPLASVGDPDCLLTVQKYNIGLTPEVSRVKKMQKNALFYGNGSVLGEFGLCWSQKRASIVRKQQKDHKKEWPTIVTLAKIVIDRVTSYKATDGYARSVGESL